MFNIKLIFTIPNWKNNAPPPPFAYKNLIKKVIYIFIYILSILHASLRKNVVKLIVKLLKSKNFKYYNKLFISYFKLLEKKNPPPLPTIIIFNLYKYK